MNFDIFDNKISSYGGNLTVSQGGSGQGKKIRTSVAIMRGNRVTLHYVGQQSESGDTNIPLTERDWVRVEAGRPRQATREEMLRVLSNIMVSHLFFTAFPQHFSR